MARVATAAPEVDEVRRRVESLPSRFRGEAARGLNAEAELTVGRDPYTVSLVDGRAFVRPGRSLAAETRIRADVETWLALDEGALGVDALLAGRLEVRGNLDLAVRLQALFRPSGRPRTPADIEQVDVRANGVSLSSYVFGSGPPVFLLHGLGGTKVSWMPLLQPLAERYRLVVPDLPGHGESDKPRAEYTPRYYSGVVRKLMSVLGVERAAFVGNSMGGRVALEMAVRYPKRVTGLALLGAAVPGLRWRYLLGITRLAPTEIAALPFPVRERWMQLSMRRLFARPERFPQNAYRAGADEFVRVYRSARARVAFWTSLRHVVMERPDSFWPRMRRVAADTLVLHGDQDKLVPLRLGTRLAEALPNSDLHVLADTGHVPQFEAPRTTRRAVLDFLGSL